MVLVILLIVGCCIRISPAITAAAWLTFLIVILGAFGYFLIARRSVRVIELGDRLAVLPLGPWYPPEELAKIEYNPDPLEDYDDDDSLVHCCEVRIRPATGAELRLTVVLREAEALRVWAEDHEVAILVNDDALRPPLRGE
ncbi:MAG TPA: hypothetical protein VHR66_16935 [Gemmataceae bacterium]|nr:hypothetical protein [Gemmataceae bacterium]